MTLDNLRQSAVKHSLFAPMTLPRALSRMGFVQADPIRAPARAQDLILRQRVKNYRVGDLERRYESLGIEEDFFTTYGFVTRELGALMHPRPRVLVPAEGSQRNLRLEQEKEKLLLGFVAQHGPVHPREVEAHFAHGTVRNYWGGSSHATTQMLDALHYRGLLRVSRRDKGIRVYQTAERFAGAKGAREILSPMNEVTRRARLDALVDFATNIYAPLPSVSLSYYVRRLRLAVPQWADEITGALCRARERLAHARVEGVDWYWPNEYNLRKTSVPERVRLLAPFDPVVHDRTRFELFWGWTYRFEAYTPAERRKLGYYALPLLWRDRVIGWGNLAVRESALIYELGYAAGRPPHESAFRHELARELERTATFLGARELRPNE